MTFGPALSLGVASLCEVVDMKITADLDPAALLDELSAGAQPGLRFVGGARLGPDDPGITQVIDVARATCVGVPRAARRAPRGGEAWLARAHRRRRSPRRGSCCVVRRIDGIGKRVDVRDFLRSIALADDGRRRASRAPGIVGDLIPLVGRGRRARLRRGEDRRGRRGAFGAELPHRAVRVTLGKRTADGAVATPLDLSALRTPRRAAAASEAPAAVDP